MNEPITLVTGGTGLIGRALISELLTKNGRKLRVQVRNGRKARAQLAQSIDLSKVEIIECDFDKLTDSDSKNLMANCNTVIHLAGLVHQPHASYQDYELLNVRTTDQLAKAAQDAKVDTFMFLSSSAVYGNGPFTLANENTPTTGKSPYAVSKILCEQLLKKTTGIKRVITLRPGLVFGEGDRGNLIKLIQSISKKRYVQIGEGKTTKSIIYSRDLAKAIILCLDKLSAGQHTLNVASPQSISMKELSSEIWQALGHKGKISAMPESLLFAMVKVADKLVPGKLPVDSEQLTKLTTATTLCVDQLVSMTGFKPHYKISAAIKSEIEWAKNNGLI